MQNKLIWLYGKISLIYFVVHMFETYLNYLKNITEISNKIEFSKIFLGELSESLSSLKKEGLS